MQPISWAIADEAQSVALGLPRRREGYGLVMFEDGERRWTWAGDPIVTAALDEHEGDVAAWDRHFTLEAAAWPGETQQSGQRVSMAWRERP